MKVDPPKIHADTLDELLAELRRRGIVLDPTPYCPDCMPGPNPPIVP